MLPRSALKRCAAPLPALVDGLVAGERGGAARHHDRARGDARRADRHLVAVAFHQPHGARIDAEPLGDQRHERRQVPLPHGLHARAQGHPAVLLEAQVDGLVENAAGHLQEAADADAAQLAGLLRGRAPRREAAPVGLPQRLVQNAGEVAAVVDRPDRRLVGHGRGRDEVAPPQLHPVDAHRPRRRVDQALDQIDRLGPAGAAIGAERGGIGEHHLAGEVDRGDGVHAGEAILGVPSGDDGDVGRRVGADADIGARP